MAKPAGGVGRCPPATFARMRAKQSISGMNISLWMSLSAYMLDAIVFSTVPA
jgi:hypothetical protein